jgi:DNA-binding response OmpR family regulator
MDHTYADPVTRPAETLAASQAPRILLVEDDVLVSMMLEDDLSRSGYAVLGPFSSCSATLAWLAEGHVPDAAILDITLSDGPCVELAGALRERHVPFIVFTGHPQNSPFAADFAGGVWIAKPAPADHVIAALREILEPGHSPDGVNQG